MTGVAMTRTRGWTVTVRHGIRQEIGLNFEVTFREAGQLLQYYTVARYKETEALAGSSYAAFGGPDLRLWPTCVVFM